MEQSLGQLSKQAVETTNNFSKLLTRYKTLCSFQEVHQWKADVRALIKLYEDLKRNLETATTKEKELLALAEKKRNELPFVKRITASQQEENAHKSNITKLEQVITQIPENILSLVSLSEQLPENKLQQKQLINDLKNQKDDLNLKKKTVNENIRLIRTQARKDTASYTGLRGKGATYMRGSITRQKESDLAPNEQVKARIESALIVTEQRINYISRIQGDDTFPESQQVSRCAYCGRRMFPGETCPGCGSDQMISSPE
jgi:hypothetical protein